MDRRKFVASTGSALAFLGTGRVFGQDSNELKIPQAGTVEPFKVLFAPNADHFGGGKDIAQYLDAIKRAHDAGFRAWEDNWLPRRAAQEQDKIGEALRARGMTMGVSVITIGNGVLWAQASEAERNEALADCRNAVEASKRVGHKWFTLIPGARDPSQPLQPQLEGAVDLLQRCCDILEPEDLVCVLEPLSHDMGGKPVLLRTFKEGYDLCKLVNRPSCKLLADFFHQQQMGGDLIKNANDCWDEIAYIQFGDVPGRKQPGTGEINYTNLVKHLKNKGYTGVYGLEHGIEGSAQDLIDAYRAIDAVL